MTDHTVTHICGGSEGCMCMYDPKLNPSLRCAEHADRFAVVQTEATGEGHCAECAALRHVHHADATTGTVAPSCGVVEWRAAARDADGETEASDWKRHRSSAQSDLLFFEGADPRWDDVYLERRTVIYGEPERER